MNADQLSCVICNHRFDDEHHLPLFLPACGHTFCKLCLVTLYDDSVSNSFKCPICRKVYQGPVIEDLPHNWTMLNLLNNNNQEDGMGRPSDTTQDKDGGSSSSTDPNIGRKVLTGLGYGVAAATGAVGLVAAAPIVLTGIGFSSAGIAAGSYAAGMMSSAAIANGGGVAAGSVVAVLQSAGAAGIGTTATAGLASIGATAGAGIAKLFSWARSGPDNAGDGKGDKMVHDNDSENDDDVKDYKGDSDKDSNDGDKVKGNNDEEGQDDGDKDK